jgi:uracil-DNA glycosylase family 4
MLKNSNIPMQINLPKHIIDILKDKRSMRNILLHNGDKELKSLSSIIIRKTKPEHNDFSVNSFEQVFSHCNKCPNIISKRAPFGSGINRVMLILNKPRMINKDEIIKHKIESDELLRKMMSAINLELNECHITSIIKCETNSILHKPSDMLKNCLPILESEIDSIKPNIIIVMGDILPLQKIVNTKKHIAWFNTDHPISLIKNSELKRSAWTTLQLASKKFLELNDGV